MDAKLIEKLDSQRYWAVILQTVALLSFFLSETILWYISHWEKAVWDNMILSPYEFGIWIWGCLGWALLIVAGVWFGIIECRVSRNKELRAALHNEMYLAYKRRAQQIALWVVMCTLFVCTILEVFGKLPSLFICELIFFLGLGVLQTSWLILNRNRR